MPIKAAHTNEPMNDGSPSGADEAAELPAWLVLRRERQAKAPTPSGKLTDEPPSSVEAPVPPLPSKRTSNSKTPAIEMIGAIEKRLPEESGDSHWLVRWLSRHGMIAVLVSLFVHSVVLLALAFILVSHATLHEEMNLWGVLGDSDELGSDIVIDTSLPVDAGESAPLPIAEMAQTSELSELGPKVPETIRFGFGGKGHGEGDAGQGTSIGVPTLKIPGHAQTKGSFSAWTDPRDPLPNERYYIVIQIRLPSRVKTYRGSDLTGLVTGTDRYMQKIESEELRSSTFNVENGIVEIRIPVPGGAQRVRDTIKIHSKVLGEKQTFEIEF